MPRLKGTLYNPDSHSRRRPGLQPGITRATHRMRSVRCLALVLAMSAGLVFAQPARVRDLTILHLNDLHAQLTPDEEGRGGFAHVATLLRRERALARASITLNAGDLVQGTPVSTIFEGVPVFELASLLGIDVNTLGNHEFDYGWQKIASFLKASTFETVNANVFDRDGRRLLDKPYVVREVGGVRLAIAGAVLENLQALDEEMGPWQSRSVVESLRPVVTEAKQKADLVVVLAHIRLEEAEAVLRQLDNAAVVVVGHTHSGIPKTLVHEGRVAVHSGGFGADVGRLRLKYDIGADRIVSHDWARLPVDSKVIPADPVVDRQVRLWESKVSAVVDVPIGRAARRLNAEEVRMLAQRSLLERFGADAAFVNSGSLRDDIPAGELLARHIWNVSPYGDHVAVVSAPGRELLELLPKELSPLVAGGGAIDPNKTYRLATVMFTARTWNQRRGRAYQIADQGVVVRDVIIEWVKRRQVIP